MAAALEIEKAGEKGESFLSEGHEGQKVPRSAGQSWVELETYMPRDEAAKMEQKYEKIGTTGTAMSFITMMFGAGVLAFPKKFSVVGMPMGIGMVTVAGLMSIYLCCTMNQAISRVQKRTGMRLQGLDDIGFACYGNAGRLVVRSIINSFLVAKVSVYIVLSSQNLTFIMSPPAYRGWVIIGSAVFISMAFVKSVSMLEKISIVSVVCSVCYFFPIIGASLYAHFEEDSPSAGCDFWKMNAGGFTVPSQEIFPAFTIFVLGFGPVEVIATARRNIVDENRMPQAIIGSHIVTAFFYALAGAIGFWGFGESVDGDITQSMRTGDDKWLAGYGLAAAVVVNLVVTIPITLYCLYSSLEGSLGKMSPAANVAMRVSIVMLCSVIGLLLPYFMQCLEILSAAMIVPLAIFLPMAVGIKSAHDDGTPYSWSRYAFDLVLWAIGFGCFFMGMYSAIDGLKREMQENPEGANPFAKPWF